LSGEFMAICLCSAAPVAEKLNPIHIRISGPAQPRNRRAMTGRHTLEAAFSSQDWIPRYLNHYPCQGNLGTLHGPTWSVMAFRLGGMQDMVKDGKTVWGT
jgi:hypothetical protein